MEGFVCRNVVFMGLCIVFNALEYSLLILQVEAVLGGLWGFRRLNPYGSSYFGLMAVSAMLVSA